MKIFCVGRNYAKHAKELNNEVPSTPLIFMKPKTALLPNGLTFYYPEFSNDVHYEGEIVVRISKSIKSLTPSRVKDFIDGVSVGIDFTARDIQAKCKEKGHPWELAKSFDFSAAIGDFINLDLEEISQSEIKVLKNGEQVQHGSAQDMIFDIPTLVSFISHRFTLHRGDLIYTGTPAGVGPITKGDVFEIYLNDKRLLVTDIK